MALSLSETEMRDQTVIMEKNTSKAFTLKQALKGVFPLKQKKTRKTYGQNAGFQGSCIILAPGSPGIYIPLDKRYIKNIILVAMRRKSACT